MKLYLQLIVIFAIVGSIKLTTYQLVGEDEFLQQCTEKDGVFNTLNSDVFEITEFSSVYEDDIVYTNTTVKSKINFDENAKIKAHFELFNWKRGEWVPTIFAMYFDDLCEVLFDPDMIWGEKIAAIKEEEQVCPPKLGTVYQILNNSNTMILQDLPRSSITGQNKVLINIEIGNYTFCLISKMNIYQI